METLDNIARKYGADKSYEGYTKYYDRIFRPIKNDSVTLLEIGVLLGASMKMWEEYFPSGRIYGVDIDTACARFSKNRVKVFIGDQLDQELLNRIISEIGLPDIIIDDGGHKMSQQIGTFEILFKYLKPGGIYVIEDLHTSYVEHFKDMPITTVQYLRSLVDDLNLRGKRGEGSYRALNYNEVNIESICFFKSICFITKHRKDSRPAGVRYID